MTSHAKIADRLASSKRLLRGEDAGDANPSGFCPLATDCPTFCGQRQRDGFSAHPYTRDRRWDSCEYIAFRNSDACAALGEIASTEDITRAVEVFRDIERGEAVQAGLF